MAELLSTTSRMETPARAATSAGPDTVAWLRAFAGPLPQLDLQFEAELSLLWLELKAEPKPVFTLTLIESVSKAQLAVIAHNERFPERPILFVAYHAKGEVFSLGGDLDFYLDCLASNDRDGLAHYAHLATSVIHRNTSGLGGRVITLANVHARALGGGIDPARACNVMVAEEPATFCYPEINYNHFPISAVPVLVRRAGALEAERILTSGETYSSADMLAKGVIDAAVPHTQGRDWIRRYVAKAANSHKARVALFHAFNQRFGDLERELGEAADTWVRHIMTLSPLEISKLQRIAQAQERLLLRRAPRVS